MSAATTISPLGSALERVEVVQRFSGAQELLQRPPDGAPWILVEDAGAGAVAVGPAFGCGARLCFRCYFARRLSQFARGCRPFEGSLSARALACLERVAASAETEHAQQLVVQPDGHVVTHSVLPLPSCARCLAARPPARPLPLLELLSDRVGLVSRIDEVSPATALLPTLFARGARTDAFSSTRAATFGLASDVERDEARVRVIAECIERYCPSFVPYGVRAARSSELEGEVFVSDETRRHERERPAELLSWIQATRLGTGQAVWVPAAYVLLPFTADRLPRRQSSSGLAAGRTLDDAVQSGLRELEERDCFMRAWYSQESPGRCDAELLFPEMRLARVPARWGPPTIVAFLELDEPPFCSAGIACHPDERRAALSAQMEAVTSYTFLARALEGAPRAADDPPPCVGKWALAHATEERLRSVRRAWLEPRHRLPRVPVRPPEEFLVCDLTTPDVALAGVHVARVFHPNVIDFHQGSGGLSSANDVAAPPFG